MRRFVQGACAVMLAAAIGPSASAHDRDRDGRCHAVDGPFTSVLVPPPTCTSPVGLCTHGILTGDLDATYDFTASTIEVVDDPAHPGREHYTGTSVITLSHGRGQMFSDDYGDLDPQPDGTEAAFATTVNIKTGTKAGANITGSLVASGILDFISGDATGSYVGKLCHDGRCDSHNDRGDGDDHGRGGDHGRDDDHR